MTKQATRQRLARTHASDDTHGSRDECSPLACPPMTLPPSQRLIASAYNYSHWARCDDGSSIVLEHGRCCLLAATSISERDPHLRSLLSDLVDLSGVHPWVRVLINFFGTIRTHATERKISSAVHLAHPSIATSFVPGFKTLFWQRVLTPSALAAFTHLFVFDSDMLVRPASFDLVGLLRVGEAINASIIQPAPYGGGAGTYMLGTKRCPDSDACKCSPDPHSQCVVCRQPVVEVKVPLFTVAAWRTVYDRFLSLVPSSKLTADKMIDIIWCGLLDHYLHGGCAPIKEQQKERERVKACVPYAGAACAVSYATPIRHFDHRSIERDFVQAVEPGSIQHRLGQWVKGEKGNLKSDEAHQTEWRHLGGAAAFSPLDAPTRLRLLLPKNPHYPQRAERPGKLNSNPLTTWMQKEGFLEYSKYPSWRPLGSLLTHPGSPPRGVAGGPCWSRDEMLKPLARPRTAYRDSMVIDVVVPPRTSWRPVGEAAEAAYQARLLGRQTAANRSEELRSDDYPPSHGCQSVLNAWCERRCVGIGRHLSSPSPPPPLFLARRRDCHADECRNYNYMKQPSDWHCLSTNALTADRRAALDWARGLSDPNCSSESLPQSTDASTDADPAPARGEGGGGQLDASTSGYDRARMYQMRKHIARNREARALSRELGECLVRINPTWAKKIGAPNLKKGSTGRGGSSGKMFIRH
jgi:hypothetical protein